MFTPFFTTLLITIIPFTIASDPITHTPTTTSTSNISTITQSTINALAILNGSYGISGQISFTLEQPSEDVNLKISINGLNTFNSSAQYSYHIHTNPISPDGNCSSALGHLDPLSVTDSITCDPLLPQYCQEGDLAGRHGKLLGNASTIELNYTDHYIRFWTQPFSILGRSIVIHAPNTTRLACGNITSFVDGTADINGIPNGNPSNYVKDYPSKALPAGPKYTPFIGANTTDTAALAAITLPATLPDVDSQPNIILTTSTFPRTVNGTAGTYTLPVAVAAPTGFTYTMGASLPTQSNLPVKLDAKNSMATSIHSFSSISLLFSFLLLFLI